jgi:hypothetical protein
MTPLVGPRPTGGLKRHQVGDWIPPLEASQAQAQSEAGIFIWLSKIKSDSMRKFI